MRNELKGHGPVPRIKGVTRCEVSVLGSGKMSLYLEPSPPRPPAVGAHSPGPKLIFEPRLDSNSQEPQPSSLSGNEHHRPSLTRGFHPVSPAPTLDELSRPCGSGRLELKLAASIPHAWLKQHCGQAATAVVLRPGSTLIPPQPNPLEPSPLAHTHGGGDSAHNR